MDFHPKAGANDSVCANCAAFDEANSLCRRSCPLPDENYNAVWPKVEKETDWCWDWIPAELGQAKAIPEPPPPKQVPIHGGAIPFPATGDGSAPATPSP